MRSGSGHRFSGRKRPITQKPSQIGYQLVLSTDRNSHMGCPTVTLDLTLSDPERSNQDFGRFHGECRFLQLCPYISHLCFVHQQTQNFVHPYALAVPPNWSGSDPRSRIYNTSMPDFTHKLPCRIRRFLWKSTFVYLLGKHRTGEWFSATDIAFGTLFWIVSEPSEEITNKSSIPTARQLCFFNSIARNAGKHPLTEPG